MTTTQKNNERLSRETDKTYVLVYKVLRFLVYVFVGIPVVVGTLGYLVGII